MELNKRPLYINSPIPGFKLFLVNGEFVRNTNDSDFSEGGNSYRYKWIPKDEVWIDDILKPEEIPFVVLHECLESVRMRHGESYNQAHGEAKSIEDKKRHEIFKTSHARETACELPERPGHMTEDMNEIILALDTGKLFFKNNSYMKRKLEEYKDPTPPSNEAVSAACETLGLTDWSKQKKPLVTAADAKKLMQAVGDTGVDIDSWIEGLKVELEHSDITNRHPLLTAKIVKAHLKESKKYYKELSKMEAKLAEQNPVAQVQTSGFDVDDKENDGVNYTKDEFSAKISKPSYKLLLNRFKQRQVK